MSFLSEVTAGLDKFTSFIVKVFTNTSQVTAVLAKVGPTTIAAVLAVFYDVVKFLIAESTTISTDLSTGNFGAALSSILSTQTQTLLSQIVADYKAAKQDIVTDLQDLGITK